MILATLISIFITLMIFDLATRPKFEEIQGNIMRPNMRDVENPGNDWLGRWW